MRCALLGLVGAAAATPPGFTGHSGAYCSTGSTGATRIYDKSGVKLNDCANKCVADGACNCYDHQSSKKKCRLYHGHPAVTSSSSGYDAYTRDTPGPGPPAPPPGPPAPTPGPPPIPPGPIPPAPTQPPAPAGPPVPTKGQLSYIRDEVVALTHFNMRTFVGSGEKNEKCNSDNWATTGDAATFAPETLNVSNWVEMYQALGAKSAVLTFKHDCGFLLFDTNVTLPGNRTYPYSVMRNGSLQRDVGREFLSAVRAAGMGAGVYYSLRDNYFLNRHSFKPKEKHPLPGQMNLSDEEFVSFLLEQLREIWCTMGPMHELWFDGGISTDLPGLEDGVSKLLNECQPDAASAGGFPYAPNPLRYVGGEDGLPSGPLWSTGCKVDRPTAHGDPKSTQFCPCFVDTKLQSSGWFWDTYPPRNGSDLIDVYHHSVGQNGVLELDFAIDRRGLVDDTQAVSYRRFGDWIRSCYGQPLASTAGNGSALELTLPADSTIDRLWLREDIELGQRVRGYIVGGQAVDNGPWEILAQGQCVGNKAIMLLPSPRVMHAVNVTISEATHPPIISSFAVFHPCPSTF